MKFAVNYSLKKEDEIRDWLQTTAAARNGVDIFKRSVEERDEDKNYFSKIWIWINNLQKKFF